MRMTKDRRRIALEHPGASNHRIARLAHFLAQHRRGGMCLGHWHGATGKGNGRGCFRPAGTGKRFRAHPLG